MNKSVEIIDCDLLYYMYMYYRFRIFDKNGDNETNWVWELKEHV